MTFMSEPAVMSEVLVEVRRGGYVESVHRGSVAVADPRGRLIAWVGDPDYYTFMRSAAKPIQALAVVETGAYEAFGFDERELAVMCASHNGEPFHVEAVLGILRKIGLDESYLKCGVHPPYHAPSAEALVREGRTPSAVHCNCSGKHAGMLAVARHMGWELDGYWRPEHPVQKLCLRNLAEVADYPEEKIGVATDGCGVCVFALQLRKMAQAFARLADPEDPGSGLDTRRAKAAALVVRAMRTHPEMVDGTDGFYTVLMQSLPVVAKSGAEGVGCFGVPGRGLGGAVKVDDGNSRATRPAVLRTLEALGVFSPERADDPLRSFRRPANFNNRGEVVGFIEPVFSLHERT